jgi:hypothetical protein
LVESRLGVGPVSGTDAFNALSDLYGLDLGLTG